MHCEFIKAGSDMILTNSFGGTSFRLKLHQAENRVAESNSTAAQLARQEADKPVIVAGSVGPAELIHSISHFDGYTEGKLIIAKSNCGISTYDNGQIRYKGTPELIVVYAVLARDLGVKIIGGCCGTTPIHIKAMAQAVQNRPKEAFTQERADDLLGLAWEGVNLKHNSQETSAGRTRSKRRRN